MLEIKQKKYGVPPYRVSAAPFRSGEQNVTQWSTAGTLVQALDILLNNTDAGRELNGQEIVDSKGKVIISVLRPEDVNLLLTISKLPLGTKGIKIT